MEIIDHHTAKDWLTETPAPEWQGNCFTISWPGSDIYVSGKTAHECRVACAEALEGVTP